MMWFLLASSWFGVRESVSQTIVLCCFRTKLESKPVQQREDFSRLIRESHANWRWLRFLVQRIIVRNKDYGQQHCTPTERRFCVYTEKYVVWTEQTNRRFWMSAKILYGDFFLYNSRRLYILDLRLFITFHTALDTPVDRCRAHYTLHNVSNEF